MRLKHFYYIILFFLGSTTFAQQLSEKASITVLTCGPGEELFTAFGHSAFRVYDPVHKIDKVYNYGTFDFNAPNFYFNFAKGKLIYQLSTTPFPYFLYAYKYENRWVKGQVLNLNREQNQAIFNYLEENSKPQNKDYKYDFFYNNCATKIEDVVKNVLGENVEFSNSHLNSEKTHRDLIADYTDKNFKWGKFGIDLALGSVIDNEATYNEYKFLPDYIFEAFANAKIQRNGETVPIVKNTVVFNSVNDAKKPSFLFSPMLVFIVLSLLILFVTFRDYNAKKRSKWLDFSLFIITGTIGIIILLLWFATDHTATYKNFNFLWAFAANALVAFYVLKAKLPNWVRYYIMALIILIMLLFIVWMLGIQKFNIALLPLFVALLVRYAFLCSSKKQYGANCFS